MSSNWPKPSLGYAPEYQVSSWPYVTASQVATAGDKIQIQFPGVTRWIQVHNGDKSGNHNLSFGFTENCFLSSNSNYFTLHSGEISGRLELKCKELWITANTDTTPFSLIAGYTNIDCALFPVMTGSAGWEGIG